MPLTFSHKKIYLIILSIVIMVPIIFAGPPFNTDDPQPVDFLHWEFYIASAFQFTRDNDNLTLPHFEVNYGALPEMQIHLLTGMGYVKEKTTQQYGFMTAELGVKYRFINDNNGFQLGIFPLLEIPTTSRETLVGNSNLQTFLPVWLQKNWGKLTTYGGTGYWINPGDHNKNWIFAGWQCQYDFSETISLGGEVFYQSADTKDGTSDLAFKLGGFININEENHLLFSVGHSFKNSDVVSGYIGYQLTI
jgi:hypothetical protein